MDDDQAGHGAGDEPAGGLDETAELPETPDASDAEDSADDWADGGDADDFPDDDAAEDAAGVDGTDVAAVAAASRVQTRKRRRKAVLAGRASFVFAIGAILVIAAAGVTWVLSPGWGGGSKGSTTYRTVNIGVVPTTVPGDPTDISLSPNRIEIPRIDAIAPIVTVSTDSNRELGVPLDPKIVGWWNGGAKPGAKKGTAILDGHINYNGVKGVLADIGSLTPGDTVYVYGVRHGKKTKLTFTVTGVRTYSKTALPYAEIFDQKSVGRLAIVTCGGPFDASTGNYRDNIVVFAVPDRTAT